MESVECEADNRRQRLVLIVCRPGHGGRLEGGQKPAHLGDLGIQGSDAALLGLVRNVGEDAATLL